MAVRKTTQIHAAIIKLREGGTIKIFFHELNWFLQVIERYKLSFDLNFNVVISGDEVTLTGIIEKGEE